MRALYNVVNGSFENDFLGWSVSGGWINANQVFWEGDANFFDQNGQTVQYFLQDGGKFYMSDDGGASTLQSSTFELGGDGWISFKLGGGKHDAEVQVCLAETGEVLASVNNYQYFNDPLCAQYMTRRFVNLKQYVGQKVYVKVVDNAYGDFGFVTFDALKVSMTTAEAQALLAADKAYYSEYKQDVVNSEAGMGKFTKDILNTLKNYYANLTLPTV